MFVSIKCSVEVLILFKPSISQMFLGVSSLVYPKIDKDALLNTSISPNLFITKIPSDAASKIAFSRFLLSSFSRTSS